MSSQFGINNVIRECIPGVYNSICEKFISNFTVLNYFSNIVASMTRSRVTQDRFVVPGDQACWPFCTFGWDPLFEVCILEFLCQMFYIFPDIWDAWCLWLLLWLSVVLFQEYCNNLTEYIEEYWCPFSNKGSKLRWQIQDVAMDRDTIHGHILNAISMAAISTVFWGSRPNMSFVSSA